MDYEQKYKDLVKAVKELQEANPSDEGIQNWVNENVPELVESENERMRKNIIKSLNWDKTLTEDEAYDCVAWLEKQGKKEEKSYNTEECNCIIQDTISICGRARKKATNEIDYENATRCIEWLKSLKHRYTWKPTTEQMVYLNKVIDATDIVSEEHDALLDLWINFKKLKDSGNFLVTNEN